MTPEQKKRRFRELAKQDRIRTARELAEELEQPFLPFNEFKAVVSQRPASVPLVRGRPI